MFSLFTRFSRGHSFLHPFTLLCIQKIFTDASYVPNITLDAGEKRRRYKVLAFIEVSCSLEEEKISKEAYKTTIIRDCRKCSGK